MAEPHNGYGNGIVPADEHAITAVAAEAAAFDELVALTLQTVAASSARVYAQTYRLWAMWNAQHRGTAADLRPVRVLAFIHGQDTTKATRQRQLSALRKLAQMAFILTSSEADRRVLEALKVVRISGDEQRGQEREGKALTPAQADRVLRAWSDGTHSALRNRALIALLALTGMRRAEAAALRWSDIDFDNGVVTIRHGKGDKARSAPIAGEYALTALREWQTAQDEGRVYLFCAVNKSDKVGADKPITGTDVYRIIAATTKAAGVDFKPHDLRRTFITEALATGTPIQTVQAAAGHARGDTTLKYAQTVNAREARKALKLRYGD